jgi:hypothetical protein
MQAALRLGGPARLRSSIAIVGNQALSSANNLLVTLFLVQAAGLGHFGVFALYYMAAFSIGAVVNALVTLPMVWVASRRPPPPP